MALTTAERSNIIKLVVAMFNAAPGATYLADLTVAYEANGRSLTNLANDLSNTGAFKALNPVFQTAAEYAAALLTPLGLQANTTAVDYVTSQFNAGVSKGLIAYNVAAALTATTDTQFADAKAILNNKTTVAEYYSVTKAVAQTNVGSLQQVISTVTKDAASVTAATGTIDSGSGSGTVFTLATAAETVTGTSGNDTFNSADTTLTAADSVDGAAGTDTLNFTNATAAAAFPGANIKNIEVINVRAIKEITGGDLSTTTGVTAFNSDRSTDKITVTNLAKGGTFGMLGDGAVTTAAAYAFGYAAAADAATLNFANGTVGTAAVTLTGTGVLSTTINSTGAANAAASVTNAATSKATTINATTNLTLTGGLTVGADTSLTLKGAGLINIVGGALGNAVTTIDASGSTGGVRVAAGNSTTIKFTGGTGADQYKTGADLATGAAVDGGAGTDTLILNSATVIDSAAKAAFYSNFEAVSIGGGWTADLDLLAAKNTLAGLTLTGSATVNNINAATAAAVTVTANTTAVLSVKGATNPGQLDVLNITVNDSAAAVNTITLNNLSALGVEAVNFTATDNITINAFTNLGALTTVSGTGAGAYSLTTGAVALNPNLALDFSTATGAVTFDATNSTTNGFSIKGGAGVNTITGGKQVFTADLSKSVAKADVVTITNATGGTTALANAAITGFTNATTTGDKIDVIGAAAIQANVAAGTATGIAGLTGAVTSGIMTFAGTAAATATLADKINAAASANFAGAANEIIAFEHAGNTYIVSQQATADAFDAGTDLVVQLTGLTGVTALSTAASGATTIFVA